jgi:multidrug efflux pump subunit AcrB
MKGWIDWFARNGVASNLVMFVILAGGLLTAFTLRKEVFPEVATDMITVTVPYPGAAPEEVEKAICVRIEERIQDLQGIDRITSSANEGSGTVTIELIDGADVREVLDDVKGRVDAIDTFPDDAEEPIVQELLIRRQVINVAVWGDADEATLKHLGERVRDDISAIPGITQVELASVRPYEIAIEVAEDSLRRHGLTFDFVASAVRRSSLDIPGGSIRTEGGEILVRTQGQAYRSTEFEKIPLMTRPDGSRVLVGDVARVVDGFAETDQSARFDGRPAVLVQVFRVGQQDAVVIADAVKQYVATARERVPEGITLTTWQDDTQILQSRLDLLVRNGLMGLGLVLVVLALFLRFRLAGWVALGIPVSFLGAIWIMPSFDITINLLSLFAFLIVLGIVVDDAIVVGENVFRHFEMGKTGLKAAIEGAQEVSLPVTFSILTTIAAFSPLLMVGGAVGKFMKVVPIIVIATLVFSLIESLFVLPSHLAGVSHKDDRRERDPHGWTRLRLWVGRKLEWLITRSYEPTLVKAMEWRYTAFSIGLALVIVTFGLVGAGWIKFTYMPDVEADNVVAMLTMPLGTPAEVTERTVRRIEDEAMRLQKEIEEETGQDVFRHVLTSIGEQPFRTAQSQGHGGAGTVFSAAHLGEVNIELVSSEERDITSAEIASRLKERVGQVPDAVELTYSSSLFGSGEDVNVQLSGNDLDELRAAAEALKARLAEYTGVTEIADTFRAGKEEIKVDVTPEGESMGLTRLDVGRQVRQAFYGEEAQRIQRGRDELRVMVRYPEDERRSIASLEEMRIRTPDGGEIPFGVAGTAEIGRGYAEIRRVDRRRAINVTADVDATRANANEINASLASTVLPDIRKQFPGVRFSYEGQQREQAETTSGLRTGFAIALMLIYALLAIPFKSYIQPAIVMSAIPFGIVGAVWGHVVMGYNLTMLSMFGVIALTGVVVNDSLVLVDFINRAVRGGQPMHDAIRQAGRARFRPILLTSLTTFVGLLPLVLERSMQAQFLIPMAISLAFGVLFATFVTLLIVPIGYLMLEDLQLWFMSLIGKLTPAELVERLEERDGPTAEETPAV